MLLDIWYQYREEFIEQAIQAYNSFDKIKNLQNIPYLLIYQKCDE